MSRYKQVIRFPYIDLRCERVRIAAWYCCVIVFLLAIFNVFVVNQQSQNSVLVHDIQLVYIVKVVLLMILKVQCVKRMVRSQKSNLFFMLQNSPLPPQEACPGYTFPITASLA